MFKQIFLTITGIFLSINFLYAHPASNVEITFNNQSKILNVQADHQVRDNKNHFIKTINVYINDRKVITQQFKSQVNNDVQKAVFIIIDAKANDVIKVDTECSIQGKLAKSIVVK